MSDGEVLDFSLNVAKAYFLRRTHGAGRRGSWTRTGTHDAPGAFNHCGPVRLDGDLWQGRGAVLKPAWSDDDPDAQTAAVQALVDTGMSVKDAMGAFKTGPPEKGYPAETISTQLPALIN